MGSRSVRYSGFEILQTSVSTMQRVVAWSKSTYAGGSVGRGLEQQNQYRVECKALSIEFVASDDRRSSSRDMFDSKSKWDRCRQSNISAVRGGRPALQHRYCSVTLTGNISGHLCGRKVSLNQRRRGEEVQR